MGAFFTNVQVRGDDPEAIVAAVRADARKRGLDEVGDPGQADRRVVVLPPVGGWITVYDQATESQDTDALDGLAGLFSRTTKGFAVSVLVHDSDVLRMRLYRGGRSVDLYDSDPEYYAQRRSSDRPRPSGDPSKWRGIASDQDALRKAFHFEDLFAEQGLARISELLGWAPERATLGYRCLVEEGDEVPTGAVTLCFRERERPAWETPTSGPPRFELASFGSGTPLAFSVGDVVRLEITVRNRGGASKGLEVSCWGSAITQRLVEIERFEVVVGLPGGGNGQIVEPTLGHDAEGEPILYAALPEREIPVGISDPFVSGVPSGADLQKVMTAGARASIHVVAVARCVTIGTGEIAVGIAPNDAPQDGGLALPFELRISGPISKPLRAATKQSDALGNSALVYPQLVGDRFHIALLVADTDREALAEIARGMIDDACTLVVENGQVQTSVHRAQPGLRADERNGTVSGTLRGKKLERLLERMATEQVVMITVQDHFGIAVGGGLLPSYEEQRLPAITAWFDAQHEHADLLMHRFSARFDAEMATGRGIQAAITRGDWRPTSIETTAYEEACALDPGVATLREWVTRWVRIPGNERLWLCAALASRINDRPRLAEIADLAAVGDALRIALRDRTTWPAMEACLADILPTAATSREVARAFWARQRGT